MIELGRRKLEDDKGLFQGEKRLSARELLLSKLKILFQDLEKVILDVILFNHN